MDTLLSLNPAATVVADPRMCNPSVIKLWRSFFLGKGDLTLQPGIDNTFRLGNTPLPTLPDRKEYALAVDHTGAAIVGRDYAAHIDTITRNDLFGIMLTIWHTLRDHMPTIADCAMKCGAKTFPWSGSSGNCEIAATMLRRISFEGNSYESSGWSKRQIEV